MEPASWNSSALDRPARVVGSLDILSGRYGNMSCVQNGSTNGLCPQYGFNTAYNHINNTGYGYDAAGDLTGDNNYTYQYDAEGHLTEVLQGGNTISTMTYDAFGQQVQRVTPSATYDLPFEPSGRTTGFFNEGTGAWEEQEFWGGGRLLGHYDGGNAYFIHRSEVGSLAPTQITDGAGSPKGDETFYPYGQEWNYANQTNGAWQFYGSMSRYESDLGLYFTPNRFYPPVQGRWLTPDPLGGDVTNPQRVARIFRSAGFKPCVGL